MFLRLKKQQESNVTRIGNSKLGSPSRRLANTLRAILNISPDSFSSAEMQRHVLDAYLHTTFIPIEEAVENSYRSSVEVLVNCGLMWTISTDLNFSFIIVEKHFGDVGNQTFDTLADFADRFNSMYREGVCQQYTKRDTHLWLPHDHYADTVAVA